MLLAGFFAGLETGIYSLNMLRLRLMLKNKPVAAAVLRIQQLLADKQALICMTLIGTNLGIHFATAVTTRYITTCNLPVNSEVVATLALAPFIFLFSETIPKNIFRNRADAIMYRLSWIIWLLKKLFLPFIFLLQMLINWCCFFIGSEETREQAYLDRVQLKQLLLTGAEEGVLSVYQNIIAKNIMQLEKIQVKAAMIPLAQTQTLAPDFSRSDILAKTKEFGFSRFPVYDPRQDRIHGIANFFDFFYLDIGQQMPPLRPAIFVGESDSIKTALTISRKNRQPMLIITAGGHATGIVTTKNLVEYIVGKLEAW